MIQRLIYIWFALYGSSVLALGQTGHRITGEIAEKYLTENARISIAKLLVNESLAEVSTYVDEMRADPDKFWQITAGPFHYVTVPKGKSYDEVGSPKQGDAVFALKKYSQIFKDPSASDADRALAIKFIVHLIGDLHQPLHVGNGLDRGGNRVRVMFFGEASNLHSVWDSGMIDKKGLSYSEWSSWLLAKISPQDIVEWNQTDPRVWIKESAEIRDTIYPEDVWLDYKYMHQQLPTLKRRIKQAGVRIATYLNALVEDKELKERSKR